MAIAVVTDSTADIPSNLVDEAGLHIVPAYVRFGDEQLRDGVDITAAQFYARLETKQDEHPTTSQPSPGDFASAFSDVLENHERIISVHISSKFSGTYASAVQGAREVDPDGERITSIDSNTASMTTGWAALTVARKLSDGGSYDEAVAAGQAMAEANLFAGTPLTLEYLRRGGRMSAAQTMLGNVLHIRPVIGVVDGVIVPLAKVRSHRRAVRKLAELVEERAPLTNLAVMYTTESDEAEDLLDQLRQYIKPGSEGVTARIGAAIGAHLGPGTVGVCMTW